MASEVQKGPKIMDLLWMSYTRTDENAKNSKQFENGYPYVLWCIDRCD